MISPRTPRPCWWREPGNMSAFQIILGLLCCAGLVAARATAADWPQWHGPERDCHLPGAERGPASLPGDPKAIWKIAVGGGFSSPVVAQGKLVYLDENGQQEVAHMIDARTGKETWKVPFADRFEDEWGAGSRGT